MYATNPVLVQPLLVSLLKYIEVYKENVEIFENLYFLCQNRIHSFKIDSLHFINLISRLRENFV